MNAAHLSPLDVILWTKHSPITTTFGNTQLSHPLNKTRIRMGSIHIPKTSRNHSRGIHPIHNPHSPHCHSRSVQRLIGTKPHTTASPIKDPPLIQPIHSRRIKGIRIGIRETLRILSRHRTGTQ